MTMASVRRRGGLRTFRSRPPELGSKLGVGDPAEAAKKDRQEPRLVFTLSSARTVIPHLIRTFGDTDSFQPGLGFPWSLLLSPELNSTPKWYQGSHSPSATGYSSHGTSSGSHHLQEEKAWSAVPSHTEAR